MIELTPESEGNTLAFRATGKLTDVDYQETFLPALRNAIAKHGTIRALVEFDESFEGFTPGAMWEDAKFGIKHTSDFDRVATVGGPKWMQWAVKVGDHLTKADVKAFEAGEHETAWSWIREG